MSGRKKNSQATDEHENQQGSILIMVLLIISVLVVMVFESMHQVQVEATSSKIYAASIQGRALARSGLVFAKYLLARDREIDLEEKSESDHFGEFWSGFLDQEEVEPPEFTTGELNATIGDEQGKFPINFLVDDNGNYRSAYMEVLTRLLKSQPFALEPERVEEILLSVKDWLDEDDLPEGDQGAEKDYYLFQGMDYECTNGPLASLSELSLIRGIDQELYQGQPGKPGLKDLLTVHSKGKININTAPAEILAALVNPGVTGETALMFATNMVDYRQDPDHFDFLTEKDWYRNRMAGYNDIQFPAGMITLSSDYFSALITARVGSIPVTAYAVFRRGSKAGEIETVHYEIQ